MSGLPSPPWMLASDLPQPSREPLIRRMREGRRFALRGAVLAGDTASTALGNPETLLQLTNSGVCVPGSKVSLRQLLEHVDVQRLISDQLL
jgi:hypothetical protein